MTSISEIKKLRDSTGLSITQCKSALDECDGNIDNAMEFLKKKGSLMAEKKGDRNLGSGYIGVYVHTNGQVAAVAELLCETDFVAKNEEFIKLSKNLAMHVTAFSPLYISKEDIPADILEKISDELKSEIDTSKPQNIQDKILEGQLDARLSEFVLLDQKFLLEEDKTVKEVIDAAIHKFGERMEVGQFKKFTI